MNLVKTFSDILRVYKNGEAFMSKRIQIASKTNNLLTCKKNTGNTQGD